jgi:dinuclear metal center YbgI/SA1388 family protein
MADLHEIVEFLDDVLEVASVSDAPGALNGLQVDARSPVERVCVAVDACQHTIDAAVDADAQLLVVHHGLFWGDVLPITGRTYRRLKALMEADVALYSAHLPLDVHPEIGNNALLAAALGFEVEGTFGRWGEQEGVGVWCSADLSLDALSRRLEQATGTDPLVIDGGPPYVRRIGIATGGAGSLISQAQAEGLDTFVTGEGSHHTYHVATELGLNVLYAGHYATETFGVRALGERLADRFGVEWRFLDFPTGL